MLKKILSPESCAQCRLCCIFDRYDVWETPVFNEFQRDLILAERPDTEFVPKDGGLIWPYRIMDIGGRRAITMASICQEMYSRPLSQLVGFLKEGLADQIFAYADQHPEIVKHYYEGYPVLLFEKKQGQ